MIDHGKREGSVYFDSEEGNSIAIISVRLLLFEKRTLCGSKVSLERL
jgi:hypothetical protein